MSEPGDLNQAVVEEGGTEQGSATPENGIVKSESLDEEEKLELQVSLATLSLWLARTTGRSSVPLFHIAEYLEGLFYFLFFFSFKNLTSK